jgi:hypothetical protein
MDADRFADLLRSFAATPSRRAAIRAVAAAAMSGTLTSCVGLGEIDLAAAKGEP